MKFSLVTPKTSSPGLKLETPEPTESMTPERSEPRIRGSLGEVTLVLLRIKASQGATPAQWTFTKTWPGSILGLGISTRMTTFGGPKELIWAARTGRLLGTPLRCNTSKKLPEENSGRSTARIGLPQKSERLRQKRTQTLGCRYRGL